MRTWWVRVGAAIAMAAFASARAEVTSVEVLERSAFASGMSFGKVGPYEKIRGVARFSLDPNAAGNQRIVDLKRAPRDQSGRVTFESSFLDASPREVLRLDAGLRHQQSRQHCHTRPGERQDPGLQRSDQRCGCGRWLPDASRVHPFVFRLDLGRGAPASGFETSRVRSASRT